MAVVVEAANCQRCGEPIPTVGARRCAETDGQQQCFPEVRRPRFYKGVLR